MKRLRVFTASFLFLILAGTNMLFAQGLGATSGTLAGIAKDESGAPLPGVLVTITGTDGSKTATTDVDGKFIFPYLTPGTYTAQAELQSFGTIVQSDIVIRLGQRTELEFKMNPGQQETMEITSETPVVDVSSTTTGANISNELLKTIPVGRSFAASINLAPGVTDAGIGGGNLSISGASGLENTYIVDGVNVTNTGYGAIGSYSIVYGSLGSGFNNDFVKEIQVKSGGFEPEYGQALGGVVNVITKSGGNKYSGEGYVYLNPRSLEGDRGQLNYTDSFVANQKDEQSLDGGINFSGPLMKDRLFFFGAYNPKRTEQTFVNDPNAPQFSQFPQSTRIRTTQSYALKATANLTANHGVEFSAFGDPANGELGFQDQTGLVAADPLIRRSSLDYGSNSQIGRWNGILRQNMFVEASVARSADHFKETFGSDGNVYRLIDFTGPTVINFGGAGFYDAGSVGKNMQYNVKLTNIWRSHEFRYGVSLEDISYAGGTNYTGPTFTAFNGQKTTTGAIVEKLNGVDAGFPDLPFVYVTIRDLLSPTPAPTTTRYLNWFAQDSWNVTPALNVKAGIRWERQRIEGDLPGSSSIQFSNNWAPRVGLTYDYLKNGKSKAFFHYGRFYEKVPNDLAVRALISESSASGYYYDADLQHPIPGTGVITGSQPEDVEGLTNNSPYQTKSQYSNELVGGIQQEIRGGISLEGRLIFRNVQRVLEDVQVDLTSPCVPYTSIDPSMCVPPGMTYENFLSNASAYFLTNQDGHYPGFPALTRDYKAFEFTAEKRLSKNWQVLGSYRYARLVGNYEGLFRRDTGQSDPNITSIGDFALSPGIGYSFAKGPLPNDNRHIVKVFGSYQWENRLNTGLGFNFSTGIPITELGAIPFYGNDERLLTARGALGRTDNIATLDLHADYPLNIGNGSINFGVDVFNLFNSQNAVDLVQNSQKDNRTYNPRPNPDFLQPLRFQDPRQIRFLVKYTF